MDFNNSDTPTNANSSYWLNAQSYSCFYSNDKTGKWCVFASIEQIDDIWQKICSKVASKELVFAKCSTSVGYKTSGQFVVCVYTSSWEDESQVRKTLAVLRSIGITQELKYKRDLETMNNDYTQNQWFYLAPEFDNNIIPIHAQTTSKKNKIV